MHQAADAEQMSQVIQAARATPAGHKRDYSGEMPKGYDPKFVEAAVYGPPSPFPALKAALYTSWSGCQCTGTTKQAQQGLWLSC